ncbi:hypothetical protein ACFU7Y_08865 [Kitasatospora sp. NPDC057542]|uniref:hypothetical protein n=1 Tax=Streptomycetaceae TaxID=2062 RepID=UPI001CCF3F82|nr:hypothetical protein [Streptomyces sp. LS1784]
MATSDGFGPRVLRYLESARNLVGCAGGAVGLGLHFAGLGGAWWPGVVAGLYGVGALLTPAPEPRPETTRQGQADGPGSQVPEHGEPPRALSEPEPAPAPDPELVALAAYLDSVPLPPSAGVDGLLAALREAGPGPKAERIVRHRLPVAVAGYLRARTWQPWAGPDDPDPALRLGHEVDRLMGELS